jgi:hypothetical protein
MQRSKEGEQHLCAPALPLVVVVVLNVSCDCSQCVLRVDTSVANPTRASNCLPVAPAHFRQLPVQEFGIASTNPPWMSYGE